jgi:uracil-DNA glycosylase
LEELIGREHDVEHEGGRSVAIPLPHPSGASSWIHQDDHPRLLDRALELIAVRLAALRLRSRPRSRSVA